MPTLGCPTREGMLTREGRGRGRELMGSRKDDCEEGKLLLQMVIWSNSFMAMQLLWSCLPQLVVGAIDAPTPAAAAAVASRVI